MFEDQPRRMQKRTVEVRDGVQVARHSPVHAAVEGIADDGVADRAQMHTDLVSPSGMNGHARECQHASQMLGSHDARDRFARPARPRRHLFPVCGIAADWRVDPVHLQRQVQRELNGKLLRLRGRYLLANGDRRAVGELMLRSLSTFLVLFRAALRLYQEKVPDMKLDALTELAKHIDFDPRPFEKLFAWKMRHGAVADGRPDVAFVDYLTAIERVADAVNHHATSPRSES